MGEESGAEAKQGGTFHDSLHVRTHQTVLYGIQGCNAVCGIGEENQQVDCVNVTDSDPRTAVIEDGFCDVQLRPLDEVPCFVRNCPGTVL